MAELTKEQKPVVGWIIFSILFLTIVASATIGTGIYAAIEGNKINQKISGEISFIQKTFHDDGICLSVDQNKKVSFVKCNVEDTTNVYRPVTIDLSQPDNVLTQENDEQLIMNFQSGINVPGAKFINTYQGNLFGKMGYVGLEFNTVAVTNPFTITPTGSFVFGDIATIDTAFPVSDLSTNIWNNAQSTRTYNTFHVGGFIDVTTPSAQRCNSDMGLVGPSMYVVTKSNGDYVFCYCIAISASLRTEFCSAALIQNGITSATS
jgi:hypothetical protein